MAGLFFYMGRHPTVYSKLCLEIRQAFSSADEIRNGPALNNCTYLQACIQESLRMSPPVGGALWREVCHGGVSIDGHVVPQGYDVGVGIYAIQHNSSYFPDPFAFKPERWIPGPSVSQDSINLAHNAFQAFSIGPVGCIGKNLACLELSLTMAKVAWSLDIKAMTTTSETLPRPKYLDGYPQHAQFEYRLRDRFTSWKDSFHLSFQVRESNRITIEST